MLIADEGIGEKGKRQNEEKKASAAFFRALLEGYEPISFGF